MSAIDLAADGYELRLAPAKGGSIAAFARRGQPLMRADCGPSVLDTACFPLVPFSNRIAHGRFETAQGSVQLRPNFPGQDHPHTLHGFGWLGAWEVREAAPARAVLRYDHKAGEWPWPFVSEQTFALDGDGLLHMLTLRNLGEAPMPAGLGFHPYFPRTAATRYLGLHRDEWQTAGDGLPLSLRRETEPRDWWGGQPVGTRNVDTVYGGREGPLRIEWPERGLALDIAPSGNLPLTVVYVPRDADFFCVEPVSHATNAINDPRGEGAMAWLEPGETMTASVRYRARTL